MESEQNTTELSLESEVKNEVNEQTNIQSELSLEIPKEEPLATELTLTYAEEKQVLEPVLTDLCLEEPKDLEETKMEDVRIESVDNNNQNVSNNKTKFAFSLEKTFKSIKELVSYYTSCSVKKPQENNVPN
jgi:hypothetical protein